MAGITRSPRASHRSSHSVSPTGSSDARRLPRPQSSRFRPGGEAGGDSRHAAPPSFDAEANVFFGRAPGAYGMEAKCADAHARGRVLQSVTAPAGSASRLGD